MTIKIYLIKILYIIISYSTRFASNKNSKMQTALMSMFTLKVVEMQKINPQ